MATRLPRSAPRLRVEGVGGDRGWYLTPLWVLRGWLDGQIRLLVARAEAAPAGARGDSRALVDV